jgi:hypothetical protein
MSCRPPAWNLGPVVNSPSGDSTGSHFENEEGGIPLFFFSSNRPPLVTELDSPDDEMRPMIRFDLGATINTSANELTLYLSGDGLSLYFGADHIVAGQSGLVDLYVTYRDKRGPRDRPSTRTSSMRSR